MASEALEKRLQSIEAGLKATTLLALATDKLAQAECAKRQLIVHFRGDPLTKLSDAFSKHKAERLAAAQKAEADAKNSDGAAKKRTRADDENAMTEASSTAIVVPSEKVTPWRVTLWQALLAHLKLQAGDANQAGKHTLAQQAVETLFSLNENAVVHACYFHTEEPVDDKGQVWRCTLTLGEGCDGSKALDLLVFDCRPFSNGNCVFHRNHPKAGGGKLAKDAAEKNGIPQKGKGKGKGKRKP